MIIVPAMNYPAFRAGTRTSPIDKGNMNRIFPGRPDGTVTEKIADFFNASCFPRPTSLDFHSGGRTLDFVPFAAAHVLARQGAGRKQLRGGGGVLCPWSMKMIEIDAVGMYDTAAEEMGKLFVTTELGGGGTSRAETVRIARRGAMNPCATPASFPARSISRRPAGSICPPATASPSPRRTG